MSYSNEDVQLHFFNLATQYYVAGRYATEAGLVPVAGNLFHHSVEMYLKGALGKNGMNLSQLRKLDHKLRRVWIVFKTNFGLSATSKHDQVMADLDGFEELRYPDSVLNRGMIGRISMTREPGLSFGTRRPMCQSTS